MKRHILHLLLAAAFALPLNFHEAMAETQVLAVQSNSLAPFVEKTSPAVVNIYAQKLLKARTPARLLDGSGFWRLFRDSMFFSYGRDGIENSLGSGVIVSADGIVVTNNHVIEDADEIAVTLAFRMPAFKPWSMVLTRAGQELTLKRTSP